MRDAEEVEIVFSLVEIALGFAVAAARVEGQTNAEGFVDVVIKAEGRAAVVDFIAVFEAAGIQAVNVAAAIEGVEPEAEAAGFVAIGGLGIVQKVVVIHDQAADLGDDVVGKGRNAGGHGDLGRAFQNAGGFPVVGREPVVGGAADESDARVGGVVAVSAVGVKVNVITPPHGVCAIEGIDHAGNAAGQMPVGRAGGFVARHGQNQILAAGGAGIADNIPGTGQQIGTEEQVAANPILAGGGRKLRLRGAEAQTSAAGLDLTAHDAFKNGV